MEIALVTIGAAFGAALLFHAKESAAWRAERTRLLDRIMARSYTDFVYTTQNSAVEPDRPQMTTDAAEAAYAQEQESIDRAWHERNAREHPEQYPDGVEVVA